MAIIIMNIETPTTIIASDQRQVKKTALEQVKPTRTKAHKRIKKKNKKLYNLEKTRRVLKVSNYLLRDKIKQADLELELIKKSSILKNHLMQEAQYLNNPFNEELQRLTLSDRQIVVNGPINHQSANFVTERVNFYNNKSETLPIFLMLTSPGGSVIKGYQIIQSINNSPAPVYVVVKEFVASMAAIITASAKYSFAFPNALFLFHEPSTMTMGNTSALREEVKFMEEIENRLMIPLLDKFGYRTIEQWRKALYKHSSSGDWREFATEALNLKWVNQIVHHIQDTAVRSIGPISSE